MGKTFWIILILGFSLRLVNLNQSFWLDEASQAQMSSLSTSEIWFGRSGDFHPPLFYLVAHVFLIFSHQESWLRLSSVVFGVLSLPAIYFLSKIIFTNNLKLALINMLLLAINPFHVYYSQEFRPYSLLMLFSILLMVSALKKHWTLCIIAALMFYTHYSSVIMVISIAFYFALFERDKIKHFSIHILMALLLYSPWIPQFIRQLSVGVSVDEFLPGWRNLLTTPALKAIPLIIFKLFAGRINIIPEMVYFLYICFVLAVFINSLYFTRTRRPLLFLWLFLPIIISLLISIKIPQTQPFRLIFILPSLIFIQGQAIQARPKTFLTLIIYIVITGNFLYFSRPRLQREQWRQAIAWSVNQHIPIGVKFSAPFSPFSWYSPQMPVFALLTKVPASSTTLVNKLPPKFLLFDYLGELSDQNRLIESHIKSQGYKLINTTNYEGVGLIYTYSL
jgi:uncharacterized membrane protein